MNGSHSAQGRGSQSAERLCGFQPMQLSQKIPIKRLHDHFIHPVTFAEHLKTGGRIAGLSLDQGRSVDLNGGKRLMQSRNASVTKPGIEPKTRVESE